VLLGVLAHEPHAPRAQLGIDLLRHAVYPLGLKQQRHQTRDGSPHPRSRPRPRPRPRSRPRALHRCVIGVLSTENPDNATVEPPTAPKRPQTTPSSEPSSGWAGK